MDYGIFLLGFGGLGLRISKFGWGWVWDHQDGWNLNCRQPGLDEGG